MADTINVDYLVIGAGAMGMAFVDTLLTDTEKTVAIVDRYPRPGGHWTVAYPFVRLHQPSHAYGVNSKHLGNDEIDKVGLNKGLFELASRDEICAYYDSVLYRTFLPSGRVAYYPKHEYTGGREFKSLLTGKTFQVGEATRIVDATYMKVKVPSMAPPAYAVAEDVELVTPNDMASATRPYARYNVIGAGKTAIDTCLWLLANDIEPDRITWIMPRDSFLVDRICFQSGEQFAEISRAVQKQYVESIMAATSADDLMKRLAASQYLLQLDDKVWPTMFRFATVARPEFEQLKKIKNIVRQGHVIRITRHKVLLENGSYTPDSNSLFVDCSADGLAKHDATAIFQNDMIRLQPVRQCQQVFSAALIAHVEAAYSGDETKNKLCRPVPHPDEPADLPLGALQSRLNELYWDSHPKTMKWLSQSRLNWSRTVQALETDTAQIQEAYTKLRLLMEGLPQGQAAGRF